MNTPIRSVLIAIAGLGLFGFRISADTLPKGDCKVPKPLTDLRHCMFWGKSFPAIDLPGARLDGVNLYGVRFTGCDLTGTLLRKANLHWADLSNCRLSDADFSFSNPFHTPFDGPPACIFENGLMLRVI